MTIMTPKLQYEYIKHHVGEEEAPSDGIFAKARKAGVDMSALGTRIQARKKEIMEDIDSLSSTPPEPRSLGIDLTQTTENNQEAFAMARYSNDRDRDEQGRFVSEDDDNGQRSKPEPFPRRLFVSQPRL